MKVSVPTETNALAVVLVATLFLPLLVMFIDYLLRYDLTGVDAVQQFGPDLCLLALGSVGSVFIDPKVATSFGIPAQLSGVLVLLLIFVCRALCFRVGRRKPKTSTTATVSVILGFISVALIGGTLIFGYWKG